MSKFSRIFESRTFKRTMAYVYGWGASVVILGALFKIMHWPGAGALLTAGMSTEALIFFLSAFEPLHVEPDWSLVYPELWGLYHPEEAEKEGWKPMPKKSKEGESISEKLDKMLEEAKIGPELIQSLADGMRNLSENANKLAGVSNAVVATDNYIANLNKASESVNALNQVYQKTAGVYEQVAQSHQKLHSSVESTSENIMKVNNTLSQLSTAFLSEISASEGLVNNIKHASQSVELFTQKYQQNAETIARLTENLDVNKLNPNAFVEQLEKVTRNLSALNAVYEVYNQQVQQQIEKAKGMNQTVEAFTRNVEETTRVIDAYKEEATRLTKNLATLNTIYGNMLAAMNISRS